MEYLTVQYYKMEQYALKKMRINMPGPSGCDEAAWCWTQKRPCKPATPK